MVQLHSDNTKEQVEAALSSLCRLRSPHNKELEQLILIPAKKNENCIRMILMTLDLYILTLKTEKLFLNHFIKCPSRNFQPTYFSGTKGQSMS